MKTLLLSKNDEDIKKAAKLLADGEVVAIPTETVYGLAADATNKKAVEKIFKAKGRPQDNPLIVHVSNLEQLKKLVVKIDDTEKKLIDKFWPGPLTIIFKSNKTVADNVSAGLDSIGIRMPNNSTTLKIIEKSGKPLAAPSANISGRPSPTDAKTVVDDLNGKIAAVVDDGECEVGVESTVISVDRNCIKILRPGIISKEEIESATNKEVIVDTLVFNPPTKDSKILSPGVKYKHYSPKADVYLVDSDFDFFRNLMSKKQNALAICFKGEGKELKNSFVEYGEYENNEEKAHRLFSVLRYADEKGFKEIYFRIGEKFGKGLAVYNRLLRAAAFKVIKQENLIIGLTGPTGSGKTTVSEIFKQEGFYVIDADKIARKVMEDGFIKAKIYDAFGVDMSDNSKSNRQKLADLAFSTKENKDNLNKIMFPHITEEINRLIQKKSTFGYHKFLLDAAALFESKADKICNYTVCVTAKEQQRLERIMQRDNITQKQAEERAKIQFCEYEYIKKSDFVLYNDTDVYNLKKETLNIIDKIGGLNE